MAHDMLICGGQVVDGTGRESYAGDVAISDGHITEMGKVDGIAKREIDARGTTRFIQRSVGYKATLVNGEVRVIEGEHTGARAGQVLRHRNARAKPAEHAAAS